MTITDAAKIDIVQGGGGGGEVWQTALIAKFPNTLETDCRHRQTLTTMRPPTRYQVNLMPSELKATR